jgi:hypothetical protein
VEFQRTMPSALVNSSQTVSGGAWIRAETAHRSRKGERVCTAVIALLDMTAEDIPSPERRPARDQRRRTVVVGAGHSAATSLLALAELQRQGPGTEIVWAVRSATPRPLVGTGDAQADELPERGRLATDLAALVGDHAAASRRDQGPPAAALCASNRNLLARAGWSATAAAAGTAADWSTATCC